MLAGADTHATGHHANRRADQSSSSGASVFGLPLSAWRLERTGNAHPVEPVSSAIAPADRGWVEANRLLKTAHLPR
jgi:hypothetical protein